MQHPPTLRQYVAHEARKVARENGVTVAEAKTCAPYWELPWWEQVQSYAQEGGQFRARWLATIDPLYRYWLRKHWPESFPAGYVEPACRPEYARA